MSLSLPSIATTSRIGNPLRQGKAMDANSLSADTKMQIGRYMKQENLSAAAMHKDHPTISRKTFAGWIRKLDAGKVLHDSRGRPSTLDEEGTEKFQNAQQSGKYNLPNLREVFNEAKTDTLHRRNEIPLDEEAEPPSERTFFEHQAACPTKRRISQTTTKARYREERDPRNFFTWAVLLFAYCVNILAELVFNWDATTFSCRNDEHNKQKVYIGIVPRDQWDSDPPSTLGGKLGVYIKKYFLHNSGGTIAPPVYVVADDTMREGEFEYFQVPGLTHSTDVGGYGYLVFSKTRAGNDSFYTWFASNIVLPFIKAVKNGLGHLAMFADGTAMHAFCSCDGEASQIRVLMEGTVATLFRSENIILGKTPRSCSGVTQASDIGPQFRAEKKVMRYSEYNDYSSPVLEARLRQIFNNRGSSFSSEMVQLLIKSLLQLTYAARNSVHESNVVKGYTKFGQRGGDLNFYKILNACRTNICAAHKTIMKNKLDVFVDIMRTRHEITEEDMDRHNIPRGAQHRDVNVETMAVHNKRALVINGDCVIESNRVHGTANE